MALLKFGFPKRLILCIMLFFACFMSYMIRTHLSISIIAMTVKIPNISKNETYEETNPDYGPRFDWNQKEENHLLGAYYIFYAITSIIGGPLAERWGGRNVIACTLVASFVLNVMMPICARIHYFVAYSNRFLTGGLGGVLFPACYNLIGKWSPPDEKSLFVASLMGGTCATIITWPLCGIIIKHIGWIWAFYITGLIVAGFCILWLSIVVDMPSLHLSITQHELEYIEMKQGTIAMKEKVRAPYFSIMKSIPFWGLLLLHFGNLWGLYLITQSIPKFMSEVLKHDIEKAGYIAALPYLIKFLAGFGFGAIGDFILKRQYMSPTFIRKIFCILSHVIPGLLIGIVGLLVRDKSDTVTLIVLALGFNGAATITNLQNPQDLSPNFAGTIYGIINFFGNMTGFIIPAIVGHLTLKRSTFEEWKIIFLISAAMYIIPAIIYAFTGSGEVQPWNNKNDE